ncbi:MAG: OprO/OprP family phosphate-selective porin [Paludibacteraceae bacterium]|nr:OprO/OprP family phosphate-selective porin [Paludibacteraceae bacterium]
MILKKLVLLMAAVMAVGVVRAQDVVIKRDTVRDTIVIREVVREYILTSDTAKIAQVRSGEISKPEKKKQPIKIHFDFRGEWQSMFDARSSKEREFDGAEAYKSGFAGKYLQFYLDGNITEGLSYHYRQRLNRLNSIDAVFKSIDKAFMQYDFKSGWNIAAGKFPIAIGGWEYDAAPIDIYYSTEFWNQVYCFQLGIRGGYKFKDGRNSLVAEIANSPFNTVGKGMSNSMYSYSLLWYGDYDIFQSSYSVNVMEVKDGTYMGQVVLGNRFLAGPMTIELDWTNRFHANHNPFGDFSGVLNVKGDILGWATVFGKVDYDQNRTNLFEGMSDDEPYWIRYKDQLLTYGFGVEVFPIKKQRFFRLHAFWNQTLNVAYDSYKDYDLKRHNLTLGLTVDFTAFEIKK